MGVLTALTDAGKRFLRRRIEQIEDESTGHGPLVGTEAGGITVLNDWALPHRINLISGDTIRAKIRENVDGNVRETIREFAAPESIAVDTVLGVKVENGLGLDEGVGAVFGKRAKP